MNKYTKLSKWAEQSGLTYHTARRYFKLGLIEGAIQLPTGAILIPNSATLKLYAPAPTLKGEVSDEENG